MSEYFIHRIKERKQLAPVVQWTISADKLEAEEP